MKYFYLKHILVITWGFFAIVQSSCVHDPIMDDIIPDPVDTSDMNIPCEPGVIYFERDILPILTTNCAFSGCHNEQSAQKGVILTDYEKVVTTGEVRPFRLDNSKLFEVIVDNDIEDRMPLAPREPLNPEQINMIANWILQGAENLNCDFEEACEVDIVSYTLDIRPILENGCTGCHNANNPSGDIILDNYIGVKSAAEGGRLSGAVNWETGYVNMPLGGVKISDCSIHKIETWIDQGIKNN